MNWPIIFKILKDKSASVHLEYSLLSVLILAACIVDVLAVGAVAINLFSIEDLMRGHTAN